MNRSDIPAFPRPASSDVHGLHLASEGVTLREYLAGQALIGVLMLNAHDLPADYRVMASHAVALADLTLIALEAQTHEDAVKRIEVLDALAQESVDSMEKEQEQEGEKEPAEARGIHPLTLDPIPEDQKEPAAAALPAAAGPTSVPEGKPAKTVGKPKSDGKTPVKKAKA